MDLKTTSQYERVWDILVAHAGARESERSTFLLAQMAGCLEYRFGGSLGFGGKFWNNGRLYVTCYKEDVTPKRAATMNHVNELLNDLVG